MKISRAQAIALALLATACLPSFAQSTAMLMPEGSKDLYLGALVLDVARDEGGARRRIVVLPTASGLWSNGVFAQIGTLGWDITDDPTMDYGPLLNYDIRSKRSDDAGHESNLEIQAGGFYSFMFARNISLNSRLLYGGGADSGGLQLKLDANFSMRLAAHDMLTISPGVSLVDASFMKSTYGISAQQAQLDGLPPYRTHGGVRSVYLDVNWDSELSTKFTLDTGVSLDRLAGSAARSPLIAQRISAVVYTALSYHY